MGIGRALGPIFEESIHGDRLGPWDPFLRDDSWGSVGALGPIWRPKADFLGWCGRAKPPHCKRGVCGGAAAPPHSELVQDFRHQA